MIDLIKLFKTAKEFRGTPAELQETLKNIDDRVISVGDDLSFVVKLDREINIDKIAERFGGRKWKLYPFKKAYRFEKGYIAVNGTFLRISRELDERILTAIQEVL